MEVADGAVAEADVTLGVGDSQTHVKPEVFTKEQVEKAVRDARTADKADVGRLKAEAERTLKAAMAVQERIAQKEREAEEAELEAAKDEPDILRGIRERQRRRQLESELAQARTELSEQKSKSAAEDARKAEEAKVTVAKEIAARLKVNPTTLAKLAKFTDGTAEAIEDIAKSLPKVSGVGGFRPDSNRSEGGGTQTVTDVRKDFAEGRITNVQYAEKMKALGVQP